MASQVRGPNVKGLDRDRLEAKCRNIYRQMRHHRGQAIFYKSVVTRLCNHFGVKTPEELLGIAPQSEQDENDRNS